MIDRGKSQNQGSQRLYPVRPPTEKKGERFSAAKTEIKQKPKHKGLIPIEGEAVEPSHETVSKKTRMSTKQESDTATERDKGKIGGEE